MVDESNEFLDILNCSNKSVFWTNSNIFGLPKYIKVSIITNVFENMWIMKIKIFIQNLKSYCKN